MVSSLHVQLEPLHLYIGGGGGSTHLDSQMALVLSLERPSEVYSFNIPEDVLSVDDIGRCMCLREDFSPESTEMAVGKLRALRLHGAVEAQVAAEAAAAAQAQAQADAGR